MKTLAECFENKKFQKLCEEAFAESDEYSVAFDFYVESHADELIDEYGNVGED